MESYVERWAREQCEAREKQKAKKTQVSSVYGEMKQKDKEDDTHGQTAGSEGHATQKEEN